MLIFVLGGANCQEADVAAARELGEPDLVVACNHAGRDTPRVDHWGSLHPALFPMWIEARAQKGLPPITSFWTTKSKEQVEGIKLQRLQGWGGSSGLFVTEVALKVGGPDPRVILCGIPLLPQYAHYDDPKQKRWNEASLYRPVWTRHRKELLPFVRSMTGWTKELLGAPTKEWIECQK